MKILVAAFIVKPIILSLDDQGLVLTEFEGPEFKFYPSQPFNIKATIASLENMYDTKSERE